MKRIALPKKTKRSAMPLYLTDEQKAKLRRMAQAEDRDMTAVMRRLIDEAPDPAHIDADTAPAPKRAAKE